MTADTIADTIGETVPLLTSEFRRNDPCRVFCACSGYDRRDDRRDYDRYATHPSKLLHASLSIRRTSGFAHPVAPCSRDDRDRVRGRDRDRDYDRRDDRDRDRDRDRDYRRSRSR